MGAGAGSGVAQAANSAAQAGPVPPSHHEADASHAKERGEGLLALGAVQEEDAGGADDAVHADADPKGACVPRGMAAASAWGRVREAACQRAGQAELKERPEKAEKQPRTLFAYGFHKDVALAKFAVRLEKVVKGRLIVSHIRQV